MKTKILSDTGKELPFGARSKEMYRLFIYDGKTFEGEKISGFYFAMRSYLKNGCKSNEIEHYLIVNELTMPKSIHRGMFRVIDESICLKEF